MAKLLTLDEAHAQIFQHARLLPVETVEVAKAAGRVLRERAVARVDLPPFASSAMDGFAVRAADVPGELPMAYRVAAGTPAPGPLPAGAAAGIATGGAVPAGADAVVPVEAADDRGAAVVIDTAVEVGQHVRPQGGDVRVGAAVVEAGTRLRAAQIGSLAAVGVDEAVCSTRPRVAVIATGSELRLPGSELGPGQIYESNRAMIAAVLAQAGGDVEVMPIVADDLRSHRAAIARGLEADVLVTSGGVSMGELDLVRQTAAESGVEEIFWGVAIKPGKPLSFGVCGATLVFGLPGNPVSSLVGALVFVTPALLARQGASTPHPRYSVGTASVALRRNAHRDEFVRAIQAHEGGGVLEPIGGQESHMIARAAAADAIVHVPRGDGEIPAGSPVRFLPLT